MGCSGSTQENTEKQDEGKLVLHKRKKIDINMHVGKEVKFLSRKPQVIVVFGGPGSRKGKLLDDVCHVYGLKLLNLETILMDELVKKLEDPNTTKRTEDIAALLKTQPELLRLELILKLVANKIDELGSSGCYVLDFMPNLKFLMIPFRNFKDCDNSFKIFENRYPISFAIDFAVLNAKKIMEPQCAVPKTATTDDQKSEGAPKQSDEADTGRLAKRAHLYADCAKMFTDYFKESERLASVDVSSKSREDIWEKICEFFTNLEYPHRRNVDTVIFFIFEEKDVKEYEVDSLEAKRVNIRDMAVDITAAPEFLIPAICKFIDDTYPTQKKFIIDLQKSSITKDCMKKDPKKVLQFRDVEENADLQNYIILPTKSKIKLPSVKALCSSENEVCLFPKDILHSLCKYIAGLYRAYQEWVISTTGAN